MEEQIKLLNSVLPNHLNAHSFRPEKIKELFNSEYQVQAINFLTKTKTTCQIDSLGRSIPEWGGQAVNTYNVTLKNARGEYTFTFYDSINNTEKKKSARLDFYSILACIGFYCPENFDEFCSDFGYSFKTEEEYIKVKQTHIACLKQEKALRKIFTAEEMEELQEIN